MIRREYNAQTGEFIDVELTSEEVAELQAAYDAQAGVRRITELRALLAASDYKMLPDYDKHDDALVAQRQAWRDEIRRLEAA